ncbi:MAG: tRNA (adenosine(37)-N6)-threonylcarbamoyltransferase complex ATPase subunit type 1 TsaE [Rickettsiales bacterium]
MSAISKLERLLETPENTQEFAAILAKLCKVGDCILLYGDVGAGKTTFARGFIESIAGTQEEIVSPTFTLVQTYPLVDGGAVWHCDLYRLKNKNELLELGLEEAFENGITLIEWPEIAESIMPKNSLTVKLDMQGQGRSVILTGNMDVWENRLKKL